MTSRQSVKRASDHTKSSQSTANISLSNRDELLGNTKEDLHMKKRNFAGTAFVALLPTLIMSLGTNAGCAWSDDSTPVANDKDIVIYVDSNNNNSSSHNNNTVIVNVGGNNNTTVNNSNSGSSGGNHNHGHHHGGHFAAPN